MLIRQAAATSWSTCDMLVNDSTHKGNLLAAHPDTTKTRPFKQSDDSLLLWFNIWLL
jgi:hypothetical protein